MPQYPLVSFIHQSHRTDARPTRGNVVIPSPSPAYHLLKVATGVSRAVRRKAAQYLRGGVNAGRFKTRLWFPADHAQRGRVVLFMEESKVDSRELKADNGDDCQQGPEKDWPVLESGRGGCGDSNGRFVHDGYKLQPLVAWNSEQTKGLVYIRRSRRN